MTTSELSPKEVAQRLTEQITAHPNVKILVNSPTAGCAEWDCILCRVRDVGYEPELGFLIDDDLGWHKTFWGKDDYLSEYSDAPHSEEVPEFNEYIILWCE